MRSDDVVERKSWERDEGIGIEVEDVIVEEE